MVNRILAGEKLLILGSRDLRAGAGSSPVEAPGLSYNGMVDDVNSTESAELREAKMRSKALEKALQPIKDASVAFDVQPVVPQKTAGRCRRISKARPFGSFCQPSIWGEQVKLWLPDTTETAG